MLVSFIQMAVGSKIGKETFLNKMSEGRNIQVDKGELTEKRELYTLLTLNKRNHKKENRHFGGGDMKRNGSTSSRNFHQ